MDQTSYPTGRTSEVEHRERRRRLRKVEHYPPKEPVESDHFHIFLQHQAKRETIPNPLHTSYFGTDVFQPKIPFHHHSAPDSSEVFRSRFVGPWFGTSKSMKAATKTRKWELYRLILDLLESHHPKKQICRAWNDMKGYGAVGVEVFKVDIHISRGFLIQKPRYLGD